MITLTLTVAEAKALMAAASMAVVTELPKSLDENGYVNAKDLETWAIVRAKMKLDAAICKQQPTASKASPANTNPNSIITAELEAVARASGE